MPDTGMYLGGEVAHTDKEETEGELKQKGKDGRNLNDPPRCQLWLAKVSDAETSLGRWVLYNQVFPKPLLHEDGKRRRDETEHETGEPQHIDSDVVGRRSWCGSRDRCTCRCGGGVQHVHMHCIARRVVRDTLQSIQHQARCDLSILEVRECDNNEGGKHCGVQTRLAFMTVA